MLLNAHCTSASQIMAAKIGNMNCSMGGIVHFVDPTTNGDLRLQQLMLKETWLTSRYVLFTNYLKKQSALEKASIPKPQCTVTDFLKGRKQKSTLLCYGRCHYEKTEVRTGDCAL